MDECGVIASGSWVGRGSVEGCDQWLVGGVIELSGDAGGNLSLQRNGLLLQECMGWRVMQLGGSGR